MYVSILELFISHTCNSIFDFGAKILLAIFILTWEIKLRLNQTSHVVNSDKTGITIRLGVCMNKVFKSSYVKCLKTGVSAIY